MLRRVGIVACAFSCRSISRAAATASNLAAGDRDGMVNCHGRKPLDFSKQSRDATTPTLREVGRNTWRLGISAGPANSTCRPSWGGRTKVSQ
jgi:hypothetical protein